MILYVIYGLMVEKAMGTTPNIYKVYVAYCEGKRVILVLDDVEKKDYLDVTVQMKGLKVLKADSVAFVKKTEIGQVRIESSDNIDDMAVICAAAYYNKKVNKENNLKEIAVEAACSEEKDIITYTVVKGENDGEYKLDGEIKRPRILKRIRLTF